MTPDTSMMLFIPAAFAGGSLGKISKIPGGSLLGATVAVAAASIFFNGSQATPPLLIFLVQVLTGCMLGHSINRRFWQDLLQIWQPSLMVVGMYTLLAMPFVALLVWLFGFDGLTALLAATPARMQDMIILAGALHTDAVTVMLMQLIRQFAIIGITPFLLARYVNKEKTDITQQTGKKIKNNTPPPRIGITAYTILLIPSIIGGIIGNASGHSLGALLGAFCCVAASRILWSRAGEVPFPKSFGFVLQCLAGIILGSRVTLDTGALILDRLLPLTAVCLYVLLGGFIVAWILHRHYKWDKILSWMAAAPGRASDMLAISQDINFSGHERLALASVHTIRQVYFTLLISLMMIFA